ncbi:type I-E CRISPR-associated protein Cas6/Cse3/CasE [Corynebacterium sp. NPDC060344]|uniref:type I-E CRISPR-associated protein Cas6/Cse3/CasE n=1 Tax=Corynebacterium sp. NPDC060344 TaxID=3347101 RepID=UPI0036520E92
MSTFTRIYLNPRKRGGRKLLTNPEAMHAAVRAAFPPDIDTGDSRVLWRADSQGDEHVLYIVGPETPDAVHIIEQAGWDTRPPQTADYARLQGSLVKGQKWAFELLANPVSSKAGERGTRGKVVAHVTAEHQLEWLNQRAESAGFRLLDDVRVVGRERLSFNKGSGSKPRRVSISTARFSGTLEVTDVDALRSTLNLGIGRARAYGCGLLTLARHR